MPQPSPRRILHLHGFPGTGRAVARSVDIANGLGSTFIHCIAVDRNTDLPTGFQPGIAVDFELDFPPLSQFPTPRRLLNIARAMDGYDLVCTYGWGGIHAVLAHTLYSDHLSLPPLVHHEDGYDETARQRASTRRVWFRRIALGKTSALVVPDEALEKIALADWQQPIGRVRRISDGVDTSAFARHPRPDALPRLLKRAGELWTGCLTQFDPAENLSILVRAFARLAPNWHLVLLGDGPERKEIELEVDRLRLNDRVHIRSLPEDPAKVLGLFDIYALAGLGATYPPAMLQAMAAGLPVTAVGLGNGVSLVAVSNAGYVWDAGKEAELGQSLHALSLDENLRKSIGAANRAAARSEHERSQMMAQYRRLYTGIMDRGACSRS